MLAIIKLALVNHGIPEVQLSADGRFVGDSTHEFLSVAKDLLAVSDCLVAVCVDCFVKVLESVVDIFDQGRQSLNTIVMAARYRSQNPIMNRKCLNTAKNGFYTAVLVLL